MSSVLCCPAPHLCGPSPSASFRGGAGCSGPVLQPGGPSQHQGEGRRVSDVSVCVCVCVCVCARVCEYVCCLTAPPPPPPPACLLRSQLPVSTSSCVWREVGVRCRRQTDRRVSVGVEGAGQVWVTGGRSGMCSTKVTCLFGMRGKEWCWCALDCVRQTNIWGRCWMSLSLLVIWPS